MLGTFDDNIFWQVEARHNVLDMNAGYGGLAVYLARTRGCSVVGLVGTSSEKEHAEQQVKEAGLAKFVLFEVCEIGTFAKYAYP
jgi:cyclopropane fatty-acyl-phospholipid synthase-like methyltransferase